MKTLLFVVPIVFGVAAFGTIAQVEDTEIVPVVEVLPEPEPEPVVEEKTDPELICLAMNIYHEARNQSIAGHASSVGIVMVYLIL
jgi:spore germination cell wall hydrolase CwlJ-like protein